jgi:hypothetical protein
MAMKRRNSNWGKPDVGPVTAPVPTSFETLVKDMKLTPAQYKTSVQLKEWVKKNKDHKYVPPDLLSVWGFEVKGEL